MKNVKVENKSAAKNKILWPLIALGFVLAFVLNYYVAYPSPVIHWVATIGCFFIVAILFFLTAQGQRFTHFVQASRAELRKVVWPTRQETIRTTLLVVVMVVIAGLFLWAVDSLLLWMVSFLTK